MSKPFRRVVLSWGSYRLVFAKKDYSENAPVISLEMQANDAMGETKWNTLRPFNKDTLWQAFVELAYDQARKMMVEEDRKGE